MGDSTRKRRRKDVCSPCGNGLLQLRRSLSFMLVALMVLVQPLEALGVETEYTFWFYDSLKPMDEEHSSAANLYLYKTEKAEEGQLLTPPEDPELEGYIFMGWYTDKAGKTGIVPSSKFDFQQPVGQQSAASNDTHLLYANYVKVRDESNTTVVTDGYADDNCIIYNNTVNQNEDLRKWFMFTPEVSGEYTFNCKSKATQFHWLGTNYICEGVGENLTGKQAYTKTLEAGKTYYWYLLYYNSNSTSTPQFKEVISFSSQQKKNISTLTYNTLSDQTYTGSEIKPKVTVKDGTTTLKEGTDYTLTYKNNIDVNVNNPAQVIVTAVNGSAYTGSKTLTFRITQAQNPPTMPETVMEVGENVTTVGEVSLPSGWSWKSTDSDKALVSGGTVSATAEYTAADKSNYKTKEVTVSITKKAAVVTKKEIGTLSITPAAIADQTYTGNEIKPVITIKDGNKTLTLGKDYTLEYMNNITVSTNAAVVIKAVEGSDYTGTCTKNFTIVKAPNPPNMPKTSMDVAYNVKTVQAVSLPSGWSWRSSDAGKTLAYDTKVTAVAEYTGSDKANYNNVAVTVSITRQQPVITDFTLNASRKDLRKGEEFTLSVDSITPPDADYSVDWNTVWSSNNEEVATVDENGKVTAVSSGTAVITAKIQKVSKTCTVVVTNGVTDFTLNKTQYSLKGGEKESLSVATIPEKPDAYTVIWSSDNEEVATVDNQGNVTAAASGAAQITATINGIAKTCRVTVSNPITAFMLNKTEMSLTAGNGETLAVVSTTPEKPDDYTVNYSSNNENIARVSSAGRVTAVAQGDAVITVEVNGIRQTCQVTVSNPETEITLTGIEIDPETMALKVGESRVIDVSPTPAGAVMGEIVYSSYEPSIAEVDADTGTVTAKRTGIVKIKVTAKGFTKECTVNVSNPVTGFSLNKTATVMKTGDTERLSITTVPEKPDKYTVKWTSDNEAVATVSEGTVTAVSSGTAVITAEINGMRRSCTVTVGNPDPVLVTGITLDISEKTLNKKDSFSIKITEIAPDNADNREIAWVSSDSSIATVDENGTVVGIAPGQAVIMAIAKDGSGVTASCTVTVNPTKITAITLDADKKTLKRDEDVKLNIMAILPVDADNKVVEWESSDSRIAMVDENGKVTGVLPGTAIITVRAKDGSNVTASCTVTVKEEASEPVKVKEITLDINEKTLKKGESFQLNIKAVIPEDADNQEIEWVSSNSKTATVDENGKVTGIAAGTAVITAKAKDGSGVTASCTVTVKEDEVNPNPNPEDKKVKSLKITGSTKKVAPGKKLKLKVKVYPENAANKQVIWKVNNKKYASVNRQGVVTAKKAGRGKKVTVTAISAENNKIKATYKISIMKNAVKKIKLTGKKTLKVGKSTIIKAKFFPVKGISKELTWTSNNKKIATVNSKGKVTAKGKGKVKITAKAKDGSGKKASIIIRIK